MRCFACDKELTDFESTRKIVREDGTIEYPDLCNECFTSSELDNVSSVVIREDLQTEEEIEFVPNSYDNPYCEYDE